MHKTKLLKNIICFCLSAVLILSASSVSALALTCETQYEYSTTDIAWLSDINIKLNLDSVSGLVNSLVLKPVADYPYSETAESFKKDVDNYSNIYLLNEGSPRAAYIYFFELLSSSAGMIAGEMSDSDIASFFKAQGIDFNLGDDKDSLIIARAIYTAIVTGTITDYSAGSSLDRIAVDFICNLSGMNAETLSSWMPSSENPGLDDYMLAASKCALWTAGYDVDSSTEEGEVYKLLACMVIEQNGITADTSSDFNTLKSKFLAAMLSKKYNISADWEAVGNALDNDTLALYVLKTIGMRDGVSTGERNFEDAFLFIAEKTGEFNLENEFYADIYNYTAEIPSGTSKIWVKATPVCSNGSVVIMSGDTLLENDFYTAVEIDPSDQTQTINFVVTSAQGSSTSTCTYNITLKAKAPDEAADPAEEKVSEAVDRLFLSSETLLAGVLANINLDTSNSSLLGNSVAGFDSRTKSVMTVIAPTFDDNADNGEVQTQEQCIDFLDKIGKMIDSSISGINGISVLSGLSAEDISSGFVSFSY